MRLFSIRKISELDSVGIAIRIVRSQDRMFALGFGYENRHATVSPLTPVVTSCFGWNHCDGVLADRMPSSVLPKAG